VSILRKSLVVLLIAECAGFFHVLQASEIAAFCDPAPFHSVYGPGRQALPKKNSQLSLSVMPYYQYARYAQDAKNKKVGLGDRLGLVNMLGLLINDDASSYTLKFGADGTSTGVSTLHTAYADLKAYIDDSHSAYATFLGATYEPLDVTDVKYGWGKYETDARYSRIGARAALEYCFANGVAVAARGGVAEYAVKQPTYVANPIFDSTSQTYVNAATTSVVGLSSSDAFLISHLQPKLMTQARQTEIGTQLGYDFNGFRDNDVEDVTVELSWRKGFSLKDNEGDHVLTAIPLVAISATLPVADTKKLGRFLDIPVGNEGFYGFTGQAEVSLDFPGTVKVGGGVVGTLYNEDAIGLQFAPTSIYQTGIYPWQIAMTKRPGALWKAYAMARADNFLDGLSFFTAYTYVSHEADKITCTGAKATDFLPLKLGADGRFNAQLLHFGFEYELASCLRAGIAMQTVFSGAQVWKTATLAASLSFVY